MTGLPVSAELFFLLEVAGEQLEALEAWKKSYREVSRVTFRKDSRVNIRLPKRDVTAIQVKAMEEGIPYQAMMASILHKYVVPADLLKSSHNMIFSLKKKPITWMRLPQCCCGKV